MSRKTKNSVGAGSILLFAILVLSVAAAAWSLVSGKSLLSDALFSPPKQPSANDAEDHEEPDEKENSGGLVFGQIPQSTDNSGEDEPSAPGETQSPDPAQSSGEGAENLSGDEPSASEEPSGSGETQSPDPAQNPGEGSENPPAGEPPSQQEPPAPNAPGEAVGEGILILVNKTHALAEDYWPDDMVTVTRYVEGVGNNDTRKMRREAAEALEKLFAGAEAAGHQIKMRTGFRSYSYQASLFSSYASKNGEEAANKYSARAGQSEHQTGLCCDVSSPSVSWALSYNYGNTDEGKWLAAHAHEYGFIIRYLEGKEEITGYVYEPWHIRYVGVDAAKEIYEKGMCLEEYLGITN